MEHYDCHLCWKILEDNHIISVTACSRVHLNKCKPYFEHRIDLDPETRLLNDCGGISRISIDENVPLCSNCFAKTEELLSIHEAIGELKLKIDEIVDSLTAEILKCRSLYPLHKVVIKEEDETAVLTPDVKLFQVDHTEIKTEVLGDDDEAEDSETDLYHSDSLNENESGNESNVAILHQTGAAVEAERTKNFSRGDDEEIEVSLRGRRAFHKARVLIKTFQEKQDANDREMEARSFSNYKENIKKRHRDPNYVRPERFECDICKRRFKEKHHYLEHYRGHTGEKPYACTLCGKKFAVQSTLNKHMKTIHSDERPHVCDQCGRRFKLKTTLTDHTRVHTEEKTFQCDECGQFFRYKRTLRQHQKLHRDKLLPFKCTCGMKFGEENEMAAHECTVLNCTKCDKVFSKKKDLSRHIGRAHSEMNYHEQFKCKLCEKQLKNEASLVYHMKVHNGELPYICQMCPKRFIGKRQLIIHTRSHTGERPYECTHCFKKFASKNKLDVHLQLHSEGKNFVCETCGARFKQQKALCRHRQRHNNVEKKLQCDQCGNTYPNANSLASHKKLHAESRPYNCTICGKGYILKTKLECHVRTHTGEKPYECEHCGRRYTTNSNLSQHKKTCSATVSNFADHSGTNKESTISDVLLRSTV